MDSTVPITSTRLLLSGIQWHIHAGDIEASSIVAALGEAMSLPVFSFPSKPNHGGRHRELYVYCHPEKHGTYSGGYATGQLYCLLASPRNNDMLVLGMSFIALTIAHAELLRGGLLIHGALARAPNHINGGIILAGSGTVGKTTAINRLPSPWHSLSDDSSLVVRDDQGQYMAHPWPTWSRLYCDPDGKPGPAGKWDVQNGIPLKALFFLAQSKEDKVTPLPATPAIAYLMETVQHVSSLMTRDLPTDEIQELYRNQLNAAEKFIHSIPAYTLHLSLTGTFWELIEKTLASAIDVSSSLAEKPFTKEKVSGKTTDSSEEETISNNILTVAYSGSSMNPTFRRPDLLQVHPYTEQPFHGGDVIYFKSPTGGMNLVHRIIRVSPQGISTKGDNSCEEDPELLQPSNIIGKVTGAWRNNKYRKIPGGIRGIWSGRWAGILNRFNRISTHMLHSIYQSLAAINFLRTFLPTSLQPRVVAFKQRHLPPMLKLMIKGHVIGHYDVWREHWLIYRPWKLVIDELKLPVATKLPSEVTVHPENISEKDIHTA